MKKYLFMLAAIVILAASLQPAMAAPDGILVQGKVVDYYQRPVSGAVVILQNGNYVDLGTTMTDASGSFSFAGVNPGSEALRVRIIKVESGRYNRLISPWQSVQPVTSLNVSFVSYSAQDMSVIRGGVTFEGAPVTDAIIVLDDAIQQGMTGDYLFSVPPGKHTLYAVYFADGKTYTSALVEVDAAGGLTPLTAPETTINVNKTGGVTPSADVDDIGGRIIDRNGNPVQGAKVTLYDDGHMIANIVTGADGNFKVTDPTTGAGTINATVEYSDGANNYTASASVERVLFRDHDITLYGLPKLTTGYLWGVISYTTGGKPLAGTVYLSNGMSQEVKEGGQYTFNVPAGEYEVYAVHGEEPRRMISDRLKVDVNASDNIYMVGMTRLIVDPAPIQVNLTMALAALLLGAILVAATAIGIRRL